MRFAENNRISHRQLFRQIILVFPAPFLLCLFQGGSMIGKSAVAGTVTAAVILLFYVIWLIRLGPAYSEMAKTVGNITVRFVGLFFLVYVILSAAFLADLMAQVVPSSLISGISGKSLSSGSGSLQHWHTSGNAASWKDRRSVRRNFSGRNNPADDIKRRSGKNGIFS